MGVANHNILKLRKNNFNNNNRLLINVPNEINIENNVFLTNERIDDELNHIISNMSLYKYTNNTTCTIVDMLFIIFILGSIAYFVFTNFIFIDYRKS